MLDVDGQVISADVLVERIEHLLEAVHSGSQTPGAASADPAAPVAPLDVPIHSMRVIHGQMHPPEIGGTVGLRGRAGSVVKRAVRKATSWYVEPRWILQQQLDSQGIEFSAQAYNAVYRIDNELDELRRQVIRLKMQLVAAIERTNLVRRDVAGLADDLATQWNKIEHSALQTDIRPLTREITSILDRLGAVGTTGADIDYVGFEDRFRGSTDELRASQERYLKLFPPSSVPGQIIDIGCGRGEMLSILEQAGHEVMGVDSDPDMIEACNSRGLPAVVDDGIQYLSRLDDDSLKGIFCAQVVEHLITPELERLILLAQEKLQPGGVLVIETINPRSSYALGNHFYADTSHVRPVHPETLRYICEQVGFRSVELEERSPHPLLGLTDELPAGPVGEAVGALLENVFGHQDYVIVASK
ncbi:MAG: class I SAM-dependent methyltransferase [Acidimicrobiales bacterium]|jgi:O-antigen chain-terminating methyltransferase